MATRPIKISIIGDDSNLRKSLKGASRKLEGFGKNVAKFGVGAGVAFGDACIEVHEDAPPWLWLRMGVYEVTSRDLCRCTLYKMESQYSEGDAALLGGDEKSDAGKEAMVSCREEMLYD